MTLEHLDTVISFVVIITGVSLLVTTLTQMASALLGLRGTNLRWGIETLLKQLDPSLAAHARTITQQVLHHPLISDSTLSRFDVRLVSRWKLASAVSKDELVKILRLLATSPPAPTAGTSPETWQSALGKSLENLDKGDAEGVVEAAPQIKKLFSDDPAKADRIISQMLASAEQLAGNIDQWFDSTMDRVSQRFTVHMRIWTVLFAVLVAFVLQLDAFKLFTQLSSDAELRVRLIASANALTKKADEIPVTSTNASATAHVESMKESIADHTNELQVVEDPAASESFDGADELPAAQSVADKPPESENAVRKHEEPVPQAALRSAAENLQWILKEKLKLQLVPDPYPTPFYRDWIPSRKPFWGIAASAALLSLGAPFWFNILKTLSNLRPVLANKDQKGAQNLAKAS